MQMMQAQAEARAPHHHDHRQQRRRLITVVGEGSRVAVQPAVGRSGMLGCLREEVRLDAAPPPSLS